MDEFGIQISEMHWSIDRWLKNSYLWKIWKIILIYSFYQHSRKAAQIHPDDRIYSSAIVYICKSAVDPSLLTETNTPFTEQCFVRKFTRSDNLTYDVHLSHQNTDSLRGECVFPFHRGLLSSDTFRFWHRNQHALLMTNPTVEDHMRQYVLSQFEAWERAINSSFEQKAHTTLLSTDSTYLLIAHGTCTLLPTRQYLRANFGKTPVPNLFTFWNSYRFYGNEKHNKTWQF